MNDPDEECRTTLMAYLGMFAGMLFKPENRIEVARLVTEEDLKIKYLISLRDSLNEVIARADGSYRAPQ